MHPVIAMFQLWGLRCRLQLGQPNLTKIVQGFSAVAGGWVVGGFRFRVIAGMSSKSRLRLCPKYTALSPNQHYPHAVLEF